MMVRHSSRDPFTLFLLGANLAILAVVGLLSGGAFLSVFNLQSMALQLPEIGLLALAMTLAMMSGNNGIDLSVVSIANLSGILAGTLGLMLVGPAAPLSFTVVFVSMALVVGGVCGLVNGLLIAKVGYTPILATLGTQLVFIGLAVALTNGASLPFRYSVAFSFAGNGILLGVPFSLLVFIATAGLLAFAIGATPGGLKFRMMGENPRAARVAGLPTDRLALMTYAGSGLLAAIAGIIMASRASSVKWDYGSSYLLIAILAVVMAGVHPDGGRGRVLNVVLAAVALQLLSSAFGALGLSSFLKDFTWGVLLLASMAAVRLLSGTGAQAWQHLFQKQRKGDAGTTPTL
jgi:simple sugar transport system permease protein